jgi:hypothetical protein
MVRYPRGFGAAVLLFGVWFFYDCVSGPIRQAEAGKTNVTISVTGILASTFAIGIGISQTLFGAHLRRFLDRPGKTPKVIAGTVGILVLLAAGAVHDAVEAHLKGMGYDDEYHIKQEREKARSSPSNPP